MNVLSFDIFVQQHRVQILYNEFYVLLTAIQSFTFLAHRVKGQQKNDAVLTISTHDAVVIMSETQKFVIQLK